MDQGNWNGYQNQNYGTRPENDGRQPVPEQQYGQPRQPVIIVGEPERDKRQTKNLAISSLVLGILSLVFCWIPYIALIVGIIALVQGIVSIAQHRAGQGMAVAGIITGGLGTLLGFILGFFMVIGLMLYSM